MKVHVEGKTEYERFQNLMRGLLAVPRSEIKAKMDEYEKEKQKRKRKKIKSSASGRASKSSP
jgi:hypothetical protein